MAAWAAFCAGLGMNQVTVDCLNNNAGVNDPTSFCELVSVPQFKTFWKTMAKQASNVRTAADRPNFTWLAQRGFHALPLCLEFREALGQPSDEAEVLGDWDPEAAAKWRR